MIDNPKAMQLLEQWRESYMSNDELSTGIEAIFENSSESEFSNTLWRGFDRHTVALTAALGDDEGWLGWFAHENDMGAKGLEARSPNGKFRKIKTLESLYKIIVESR